MCGATDCPSCGTAQGYEVIRRWNMRTRRWEYVNPDPDEDEDGEEDEDVPEEPERESSGSAA